MTKLFTTQQVKKFFNILDKLSGSIPIDKSNYPWNDYQTIYNKESNHCPSTREVFVNRTINKWFKGKYLIIYRVSDLGVTYKQYISISRICYYNDWSSGGCLDVGMIDYMQPYNSSLFGGEKIKHNDALGLEGEWCNNGEIHKQLLKFCSMDDVPDKEYVFKAYDWSKYPKRKKVNVDPMELIRTTKSFIAKTEHHAYELKNEFENSLKETRDKIMVSELLEVMEINRNIVN